MTRGLRALISALLGLALTIGLLAGLGTPAAADTTTTGWIAGAVTSSAGVPASGKTVTLYTIDANGNRTEIVQRSTRSDGHFWLGSQPVGRYYLLVTDPVQDDAATWWPTPAGPYQLDPFDLTEANIYAQITMTPGLDISGTVRFNGVPQEGVWVCAGQDIVCPRSDASGNYTIRGIAEGLHTLVADPPSTDLPYVRTFYPSYTLGFSQLSGPEMINAESAGRAWDFDLAEVPYIGGTVVNASGSPIAGASVCLSTSCVTTNSAGVFRMTVDLPYKYFPTLTVSARGYQDGSTLIGGGQHDAQIVLTAAAPAKPAPVVAGKPKISGKTKVGARLKVKTGTWSPAGVKLTYRWYRNGKKITAATKSTYKLTRRDWRKKITVKVTGRMDGYVTVTKTSKPTAKIRWR